MRPEYRVVGAPLIHFTDCGDEYKTRGILSDRLSVMERACVNFTRPLHISPVYVYRLYEHCTTHTHIYVPVCSYINKYGETLSASFLFSRMRERDNHLASLPQMNRERHTQLLSTFTLLLPRQLIFVDLSLIKRCGKNRCVTSRVRYPPLST
jgi:hypothetical protein